MSTPPPGTTDDEHTDPAARRRLAGITHRRPRTGRQETLRRRLPGPSTDGPNTTGELASTDKSRTSPALRSNSRRRAKPLKSWAAAPGYVVVRQPLAKAGNPLAGCNYRLIAAALDPDGALAEPMGSTLGRVMKTKPAFCITCAGYPASPEPVRAAAGWSSTGGRASAFQLATDNRAATLTRLPPPGVRDLVEPLSTLRGSA